MATGNTDPPKVPMVPPMKKAKAGKAPAKKTGGRATKKTTAKKGAPKTRTAKKGARRKTRRTSK